MERVHNVKLLERTSRKVALTEQGKLLMSYVERMVALADEAEISLKSRSSLKSGRIEIGASRPVASSYLSSIAVAFKQKFPGVVPVIHVENSQWILRTSSWLSPRPRDHRAKTAPPGLDRDALSRRRLSARRVAQSCMGQAKEHQADEAHGSR